jgi:polysaccharide deacetylase family protein (PEP-CTERM system associated)
MIPIPRREKILNAMTVDVEEHFQVSAFEHHIRRGDWDSYPSRVEDSTARLLDIFEEAGLQATFFVLGFVARRHPGLVRRIAEKGHEIASHGYSHKLVYRQTPEEFKDETTLSRRILQDASGQAVQGYRAASFSIGHRSLWALDVIAESGFTYDSSIFPILHDRYGMPGARRHIHRLTTPSGNSIIEVPPSTLRIGKMVLPVAGGGYLRLYPQWVTHFAFRRLNSSEKMPVVVYVHPWEVDPGQPRVRGLRVSSRLRHYVNLRSTEGKVRKLMRCYDFGPVREVICMLGALDESQVDQRAYGPSR